MAKKQDVSMRDKKRDRSKNDRVSDKVGRKTTKGRGSNKKGKKPNKGKKPAFNIVAIAKRGKQGAGKRKAQGKNQKVAKLSAAKERDVNAMAQRKAFRDKIVEKKFYMPSEVICASKKRGKDTLVFMVPMTESQKAERRQAKKAEKIAKQNAALQAAAAEENDDSQVSQTPTGRNMATGKPKRRLKRLQATVNDSVSQRKRKHKTA